MCIYLFRKMVLSLFFLFFFLFAWRKRCMDVTIWFIYKHQEAIEIIKLFQSVLRSYSMYVITEQTFKIKYFTYIAFFPNTAHILNLSFMQWIFFLLLQKSAVTSKVQLNELQMLLFILNLLLHFEIVLRFFFSKIFLPVRFSNTKIL